MPANKESFILAIVDLSTVVVAPILGKVIPSAPIWFLIFVTVGSGWLLSHPLFTL